jgi:hypothetical protein
MWETTNYGGTEYAIVPLGAADRDHRLVQYFGSFPKAINFDVNSEGVIVNLMGTSCFDGNFTSRGEYHEKRGALTISEYVNIYTKGEPSRAAILVATSWVSPPDRAGEKIDKVLEVLGRIDIAPKKGKADRTCPWCSEAFTYPSLLKKHLSLVTGACAGKERNN